MAGRAAAVLVRHHVPDGRLLRLRALGARGARPRGPRHGLARGAASNGAGGALERRGARRAHLCARRPGLSDLRPWRSRLRDGRPVRPLPRPSRSCHACGAIRRVIVSRGTAALPAHVVADYDGRDARIVTNSRALPRAFLVARARCANDQDALRLIRDAEVDLRHEVVLSGCLTPPPGVAELGVAHVAFTVDEADRVRLTTDSDGPAWLVLSDTWFPGWQARVDGVPQPVGRADYAFRAVALGAGRHDVEMTYAPRSVRDGLMTTLVASGVVGALLVPRRRARAAALPVLALAASVLAAAVPP